MKSRYSTIDICAIIKELKGFLGLRVVNVYDVDNKTYLIKLSRPDEKAVILLESGTRLHSTEFEWPKNPAPSGFSMKMRKHLKGRRFESLNQLGIDRIVDLQFGSGEAAYHVILELYDRGNLILTDFEYTILNILRPRTDNSQDVRFAVREKYPVENAKQHQPPTGEKLREVLQQGKDGDPLKKLLIPQLDYGPAVIEHCLLGAGFTENVRVGKGFSMDEDFSKLLAAVTEAESLLKTLQEKACKGYIIQKKEKRVNPQEGESDELLTYEEFHPFLFRQHEKSTHVEFPSFDRACDEFFSKLESQRLDLKTLQQEKAAMKKLENVKKDHEKRLHSLQKDQEDDTLRGQLIEMNLQLVDQALLIVRSALANQIDWTEIWRLVKEAQAGGDPVASCIKGLKLDTNHITMLLRDPYSDELEEGEEYEALRPMKVDIDLSLSAYANSRKYFDMKRTKAKKEQKTMDASKKAMKSAEHKTKQALKEVATVASINKARKTYWFEKFQWFISSENFLVIGGRDQQQNELIVKRYMKPGDVYVHADLHGASSVVVKNPSGEAVPPKTLTEAGTMAICNSAAWDAKVVTSAWWVHHHQVSKTAPTGEYLTTGSFMIRGKKNYLPPSYLVYGFGILCKLEDGSVERHRGERRIRGAEEDEASVADTLSTTENDASLDALSEEDTESGEEREEEEEEEEEKREEEEEEKQEEEQEAGGAEGTKGEEKEEESSESEEESAFPDTSISLQHVEGSKFALQRGTSIGSTTSTVSETGGATIFMGDDQPVTVGPKVSGTGSKLSAKQRREMRKQKKAQQQQQSTQDAEEDAVSWLHDKNASHADGERTTSSLEKDHNADQQKQGPAKRGQKSKLKKIKEKYADQDEEERKLRMEILASAGSQKEEKRKKGKKGKEQAKAGPKSGGGRPQSGRPQSGRPQSGRPQVHLDTASQQLQQLALDPAADASQEEGSAKPEHSKAKPVEEHDGSDDEKDDTTQTQDDFHVVDSLTGVPVPEDELLFAVPVCAPYSAIVNYKYKVKLLPGSTKKGKAAKIALNMFQHDKTTTGREKDLLRILKDQDVSRNMPGKVRVAAPNLQKVRK